MREMVRMRRGTWTAALLAVTVTGSLMTGCTTGGGPGDDGRAPDPGRSRSPSPDESGTGRPDTGSVLAVKIDNVPAARPQTGLDAADVVYAEQRSEEHTSELQSQFHLVCRLLLEKKKTTAM